MTKPIIEVTAVNPGKGVFTKTTLDFDVVMGISPYTEHVKGNDGQLAVVPGTMLLLKNGREMFVTEAYEKLRDTWLECTR